MNLLTQVQGSDIFQQDRSSSCKVLASKTLSLFPRVCVCARCTPLSAPPPTPVHPFPNWHRSPASRPPPLLPAREEVQLTWLPKASFLWLLPAENGLQPPEFIEFGEATDSTEHDWKQRQGTLCRPIPQAHLFPLPKATMVPPARERRHQQVGTQHSGCKEAALRVCLSKQGPPNLGPALFSLPRAPSLGQILGAGSSQNSGR